MKLRRLTTAAAVLTLTLGLASCSDDEEVTASTPVDPGANASATPTTTAVAAGALMQKIKDAGKVVIGVKFDQPGVGEKDPATQEISGFDIEMAKLITEALGLTEDDIEFKETVSANREPFLKAGTVDLVLASYSITDDRRKVVGQAGPYYVTGQQLLVREGETEIAGPDDLTGKKVCSVTGSTSIKTIEEEYGAVPAPFSTYTECVQQLLSNSVDAVTTDGAILLGYAARQPGKMKLAGEPFSTERYGVGFAFGDTAMCDFLRETLTASFGDGTWAKAFADTLGKSGVEAPTAPTVDATC